MSQGARVAARAPYKPAPDMARTTHETLPFCLTGGRMVVLDIARNRYLAVPPPRAGDFSALAARPALGTVSRNALAAYSRDRQPSRLAAGMAFTTPPPAADSDRSSVAATWRPAVLLVLLALLAGIVARTMVRVLPLRLLLRGLTTSATPASGASPASLDLVAVDRIAAAFQGAGVLLGTEGKCLPGTLAFCWLCRCFGHAVPFIVGVRTDPFSAHCWSQHGTVVLNDSLDCVRPYQPILVR